MNKQIEEMQNTLHQGLKPLKEIYGTEELCSILYDAGYRKQDEVAREIFAEIEEILKLKKKIEIERRDNYQSTAFAMFSYIAELNGRIYGYSVVMEQLAELKKKYGVTEE